MCCWWGRGRRKATFLCSSVCSFTQASSLSSHTTKMRQRSRAPAPRAPLRLAATKAAAAAAAATAAAAGRWPRVRAGRRLHPGERLLAMHQLWL
jgi:hypothetical protein